MKISNLKVGTRLSIGFSIIVLFTIVLGVSAIIRMSLLADLTTKLYEHPYQVSTALLRIDGQRLRMQRTVKDMILHAKDGDIDKHLTKLAGYEKMVWEDFKILETNYSGKKEQLDELKSVFIDWKPIIEEEVALIRSNRINKAKEITQTKGDPLVRILRERQEVLIANENKIASEFMANAKSEKQTALIQIIGLIAAIIIFSFLLAMYLTRSITRPLDRVVKAANAVAGGDTSQRLNETSKDELGQLARAVDQIPEVVEAMMGEYSDIVKAVEKGKLDSRGDAGKFEGAFARMMEESNNLIGSLTKHIHQIPTPAMILDTEYNVQFMNQAAADIAGTTSEQGIGNKCYDLMKTEHCQTKNCACNTAMATGENVSRETNACPGNKNLEISYAGSPIVDANGKILGCLEVFTDLTEIKQAQKIAQKIGDYQAQEVEQVSRILEKIAEGDLTVNYDISESDDDTAGVYQAFLKVQKALVLTLENLRTSISEIQNISSTVASSAEELSTVSNQLSGGSEEMTAKANTVAGATEQMSTNINTMASAVEELSVNAHSVSSTTEQMSNAMNTVASAVEEMSMSISEVASNAKDAQKVADQASTMSGKATVTMHSLGEAAQKIGKVTEVIKRIAEQTNLLALNATIEAASAGEAGKGFAVVANEIKELANQSAQAAEEIASQIGDVQNNSTEAISVIGEVSSIMEQINQAAEGVTAAAEQQTSAANEISANVADANKGIADIAGSVSEIASGTNDMAQNAGEAAKGSNEVASSIQGVSTAASQTNSGAHQVNISAGELSRIAGELQEQVRKFRIVAS